MKQSCGGRGHLSSGSGPRLRSSSGTGGQGRRRDKEVLTTASAEERMSTIGAERRDWMGRISEDINARSALNGEVQDDQQLMNENSLLDHHLPNFNILENQ